MTTVARRSTAKKYDILEAENFLFGDLLVVLKACRGQLGCHDGFKIGLTMRSRASGEPNLFLGLCMLGASWGQRAGKEVE